MKHRPDRHSTARSRTFDPHLANPSPETGGTASPARPGGAPALPWRNLMLGMLGLWLITAAQAEDGAKPATAAGRVNTAVIPTPGGSDTWRAKHAKFNARAREGNVDLIYIGDSIVGSWKWDGEPVFFMDVNPLFLRPDGTIRASLMPDFEHPGEEGHRVWAAATESKVAELMGDSPTPEMPARERSTAPAKP